MHRIRWPVRLHPAAKNVVPLAKHYTIIAICITGGVAAIHGLADYHKITGSSMAPTLSPAYHETGDCDRILTRKIRSIWGENWRKSLKRGDIVTIWKPHLPEEIIVKRVIGLPGDIIVRDVRRVGKQELENGKYSKSMGMAVPPPVVKVPIGHVWVEGDNWRNSNDSNDFGPISLNMVTARATRIVWPPSRFGPLPARDESNDASRTRVIPGAVKRLDSWDS